MHVFNSPEEMVSLALVPEHLADYVRAVSGLRPRFCRGWPVYLNGKTAVCIGYACGCDGAGEPGEFGEFEQALAEVAAWEGVRRLTVLAPFRPACAPEAARLAAGPDDVYYVLDLPYFSKDGRVANQKLRNMLRRGGRELDVELESAPGLTTGLPDDCRQLVENTLAARPFEPGLRQIYSRIGNYLKEAPGAALFTARRKESGELHGFCVGDFSALDTAFYMFAFRRPQAVPGTADLLLAALLAEAERRGHRRVNLGLIVNSGIGFFKRKWGAREWLPYFETSWDVWNAARPVPAKRGFLRRLLGGLLLPFLVLLAGFGPVSGCAGPAALAADSFSATENPSAGLLKGTGGGSVGQGIKPGTPVGSDVPPPKDLAPSLKQRAPHDPDVIHTDNTNRVDQNARNSPNN